MDLVIRLLINLIVAIIIIRFIYHRYSETSKHMFTYFMISTVVFLLCYSLKQNELDIGLAIGLFAVFGIIRYRTFTIQIKETTYLFVVIGISIINALSNDKVESLDLILSNAFVIVMLLVIENTYKKKTKLISQEITYPYSELFHHNKREELKQTIEKELNCHIEKIEIQKIDMIANSVKLIYYFKA